MQTEAANTSANIWTEWVPEDVLAAVLAGEKVIANIGQVHGLWQRMLEREVRAGRLTKWRGKWFPQAGAPYGLGPDKTCYGTPALRDYFAAMKQAKAA
jgi:hypothetical protein